MKIPLKLALFLAGMTSVPAMAHIGYTGRNFGTFDGGTTLKSNTLSNLSATGNFGWIDGTDTDWGDAHKVAAFRFTILTESDVAISFKSAAFTNPTGAQVMGGMNPGFSLYKGLAHLSPVGADFDSSPLSVANRPVGKEGSFRATNDWLIGNTDTVINGTTVPASLTFFQYMGSAMDGGVNMGYMGDGTTDGMVTKTFHLKAGDYSIFAGGTDYLAQDPLNPNFSKGYGLTGTVAVVPEPETWAMLLAGIGLMGTIARRRQSGIHHA